ncbi:MAG: hypothetical protein JWM11_6667 [Planctomycetaceae bacterium]|nr:hypothetical protein [Planctomycetaceae bacterium]
MTFGEKIALLQQVFQQGSNEGVLSWGATENGYRWKCVDHATAKRLAEFLLTNEEIANFDRQNFPHRFEPERGPTLIIEPTDDIEMTN